jgi:hypothetical protein
MIKKSIFGLVILGVAVASAATSYKVVFSRDVTVNGSTMKAGEYKVELNEGTATLKQGKTVVEAHVRLENSADKFPTNGLKLNEGALEEIRLGGTHTRVVFEQPGVATK